MNMMTRMRLSAFLLMGLAAFHVQAQLGDADPDWQEVEAPPPPAFRADGLVPIDMPRHMTVKLGVDPQTLKITHDGIVRYVMVAVSPGGSTYAMYEGIRCLTGEVKTYARLGSDGNWNPVQSPQWKPLNGNQASMHALALARQGACDGRAAAVSPDAIIRNLKRSSGEGSQQ